MVAGYQLFCELDALLGVWSAGVAQIGPEQTLTAIP